MVVRDLPNELMESYNFSLTAIPNFRVPAWASARYYMDAVYPVLQETRYVVINLFALTAFFVQDISTCHTKITFSKSIINEIY